MKKEYPKYEKGSLEKIYLSMSKEDKEVLKKFIIQCSITARTKEKLDKIRRHLIQFYDVTEVSFLKQTKESVDNFMVTLNNSNRSMWTKNEIIVYIKQFLKKQYKDLEMIENLKTNNKRGLNPQKITENNLIDEKDIEKMLRFAKGYKEKAYLLLAFTTGARPSEIINLKFSEIKFEDDYADVTLFSSKTQVSRTFPIVGETMKSLWELKQHYPYPDVIPSDYIFPSRWRDKPMTTNGVNKMLRRMGKSAGIKKDIWGYLLRHTRATRLYEELPTPIVEKLMGHQDQYKIYAHISSKKAREELLDKVYKIEKLNPQEKEELKKLKKEIIKLQQQNIIIKDVVNMLQEFQIKDPKSKKRKVIDFSTINFP